MRYYGEAPLIGLVALSEEAPSGRQSGEHAEQSAFRVPYAVVPRAGMRSPSAPIARPATEAATKV